MEGKARRREQVPPGNRISCSAETKNIGRGKTAPDARWEASFDRRLTGLLRRRLGRFLVVAGY
jgi:hypothetical protein